MIHQVYSIAEEIKRLREERDMTQEELAESAEISLSHLSKVESGSRMIGMKTYSKILYALNAVPIMITETEKSEIHSDLVLRLLSILKECSEVEVEFLLNTVETIKNNMDIIRNHEKSSGGNHKRNTHHNYPAYEARRTV